MFVPESIANAVGRIARLGNCDCDSCSDGHTGKHGVPAATDNRCIEHADPADVSSELFNQQFAELLASLDFLHHSVEPFHGSVLHRFANECSRLPNLNAPRCGLVLAVHRCYWPIGGCQPREAHLGAI